MKEAALLDKIRKEYSKYHDKKFTPAKMKNKKMAIFAYKLLQNIKKKSKWNIRLP